MVSGCQGVNTPSLYSPMPIPMLTEEHMSLSNFAWHLGSSNCTSECPDGIVDETRQEAQLLMSLMLRTIPHMQNDDENDDEAPHSEPISSEQSFSSESSSSYSTKRRDVFSFICPSLSLENPKCSSSSFQGSHNSAHTPFLASDLAKSFPEEALPPAQLLGRPLKVDDRDALRLSADAMARNVLQSFQKAMDWRLNVWYDEVCAMIVMQENAMAHHGACMEEIQSLLETPEATLMSHLHQIVAQHAITVSSVNTSFQVLPQRIGKNEPESLERRASMDSCKSSASSLSRDEATQAFENPSHYYSMTEAEYLYTVSYKLEFTCDVYVETPAGLIELTLKIPGTIRGKFASTEENPSVELRSVTVDLNTDVLADLVEKGCRTVARTSVEKFMIQFQEENDLKDNKDFKTPKNTDPLISSSPYVKNEEDLIASPNAYSSNCTDYNAVFVTPHEVSQGMEFNTNMETTMTPKTLLPIPDDFGPDHPRRISPHPSSRGFESAPSHTSQLLMKHRTPEITTKPTSLKRRLISPGANNVKDDENLYHQQKYLRDGQSLPLLVEVACRAMHDK